MSTSYCSDMPAPPSGFSQSATNPYQAFDGYGNEADYLPDSGQWLQVISNVSVGCPGCSATISYAGGWDAGGVYNFYADPSVGDAVPPNTVASLTGAPSNGQSCVSNNQQSSVPINGTLGVATTTNPQQRYAVNVEQIYGSLSSTTSGGKVISNLQFLGFLYIDQMGGTWFQQSPTANWSVDLDGFSVSLGEWFSLDFGIKSPQDLAPHYIGDANAANSKIGNQQGTLDIKCWNGASGILPGAIGNSG